MVRDLASYLCKMQLPRLLGSCTAMAVSCRGLRGPLPAQESLPKTRTAQVETP